MREFESKLYKYCIYELERAKEQEIMKVNKAKEEEEIRRLKEQFEMDRMNM